MTKKVHLFSPGLDSYLVTRYLGDLEVEYKKVYCNIVSMYSGNELDFLNKYYGKRDYEVLYNLNLRDIEDKHSAHVPNRNLLLVTIAASVYDADEIILGGVLDDRVSDNNDEFYNYASQILSYTMGKDVLVYSPLSTKEKTEWLKQYVIPSNQVSIMRALSGTYSCFSSEFYEQTVPVFIWDGKEYVEIMKTLTCGCLNCPACYRKLCALAGAGVFTPFMGVKMAIDYVDRINKEEHPNRWQSAVDFANFLDYVSPEIVNSDEDIGE